MCNFVQLFATPRTVTCQAPLSMRFSRQECWRGLPFPTPRDLPNSGIKPTILASPALVGGFFTTDATWEAQIPKQPSSKQYNGQSCSLMMPFSPTCVQTILSRDPSPCPVIWGLSAFSEHTPLVHLCRTLLMVPESKAVMVIFPSSFKSCISVIPCHVESSKRRKLAFSDQGR